MKDWSKSTICFAVLLLTLAVSGCSWVASGDRRANDDPGAKPMVDVMTPSDVDNSNEGSVTAPMP